MPSNTSDAKAGSKRMRSEPEETKLHTDAEHHGPLAKKAKQDVAEKNVPAKSPVPFSPWTSAQELLNDWPTVDIPETDDHQVNDSNSVGDMFWKQSKASGKESVEFWKKSRVRWAGWGWKDSNGSIMTLPVKKPIISEAGLAQWASEAAAPKATTGDRREHGGKRLPQTATSSEMVSRDEAKTTESDSDEKVDSATATEVDKAPTPDNKATHGAQPPRTKQSTAQPAQNPTCTTTKPKPKRGPPTLTPIPTFYTGTTPLTPNIISLATQVKLTVREKTYNFPQKTALRAVEGIETRHGYIHPTCDLWPFRGDLRIFTEKMWKYMTTKRSKKGGEWGVCDDLMEVDGVEIGGEGEVKEDDEGLEEDDARLQEELARVMAEEQEEDDGENGKEEVHEDQALSGEVLAGAQQAEESSDESEEE